MLDLTFVVWQFVRLMVHLESHAPGPDSVYQDWSEAWDEIDAKLLDLAESDQAAYAELMMEQEITVTCSSESHLREAGRGIAAIVKEMDAALADISDPGLAESLVFERDELKSLLARMPRVS